MENILLFNFVYFKSKMLLTTKQDLSKVSKDAIHRMGCQAPKAIYSDLSDDLRKFC